MSYTTYISAIRTVLSVEKKMGNFWNDLVTFAMDVPMPDGLDAEGRVSVLKDAFNEQEQSDDVLALLKGRKLSEFGAYRSAKSVIMSACKAGVSLLDEAGKVRGKSAVESDVKALKEEKPEIEKFKQMLASLTSVADKLEQSDAGVAFLLAKGLTDYLADKAAGK